MRRGKKRSNTKIERIASELRIKGTTEARVTKTVMRPDVAKAASSERSYIHKAAKRAGVEITTRIGKPQGLPPSIKVTGAKKRG